MECVIVICRNEFVPEKRWRVWFGHSLVVVWFLPCSVFFFEIVAAFRRVGSVSSVATKSKFDQFDRNAYILCALFFRFFFLGQDLFCILRSRAVREKREN